MADLKLLALDTDDLQVISAHIQDAVVRVGDIAYLPREKRLAAVVNRFDWEQAVAAGPNEKARNKNLRRLRSGLRFDRVFAARLRRIDPSKPEDTLALLAIRFEATEAPAGRITLDFSGGMAVELEVECIEVELRDLGAAWATRRHPQHDDDNAS